MIRHRLVPFLFALALLAQIWLVGAVVPPVAAQADMSWVGASGQSVRSGLFETQRALASGDLATAASSMETTAAEALKLADAFTSDPAAAQAVTDLVERARQAVAGGDPVAFAVARAQLWTALLAGSYHEAIAATAANQPETAGYWLLLREFRPTTRFARPDADASLAVQQLGAGTLTPEAAVDVVRADLLDTYQGLLDTDLRALQAMEASGLPVRRAELAGLIGGYWTILADAYEDQAGAERRAIADEQFQALVEAGANQPEGGLAGTIAPLVEIEASFRAAPLTDDEQARRAGQLDRYLSLVVVEYGRGVKNGEVLLDVEIHEAQAFMEGARASFNDLRLPLAASDPDLTSDIDARLTRVDGLLADAADRTSVISADDLGDEIDAILSDLHTMYPDAWLEHHTAADFDVIASVLDQLQVAVRGGDYDQARSLMLEAYAIYEVGPEKRLMAFAPDVALATEDIFWQGDGDLPSLAYALENGEPVAIIGEIRARLDEQLQRGQELLGSGRPADQVVIFNAATIVFREGLEAVLILMSLMASMVGANRYLKRPIAAGAGLALIATALLFVLARSLLMSLSNFGEKLEAVVSLIAIGVLLIIMNWFFHKVYWTKWIAGHHERRRAIIGGAAGQALGLVLLGFSSVFREGAETVLFLQALVLDAGTLVVVEGTLLGLAGVAVVGVLVIVMQAKLPHKTMLKITGLMIAVVLVTMVGSTVRVMQVVGWMPINPIPDLSLPYWTGVWLGLYATWEGIVAQVLAFTAVVGSYYLAEGMKGRKASRVQVGEELAAPR